MSSRVLIVDDTALYRTAIGSCLRRDPAFEVVGSAADGRIALKKIRELNPDLVTLDLEMPGLDGLGVLRALHGNDFGQKPKVVVFSAHSQKGAAVSLQALELGAADFALKPTAKQGIDGIADELLPKLHALAQPRRTEPYVARRHQIETQRRRRLLVILASTGGPQALMQALAPFRADFPVPVLIVQHMPPLFTRSLADNLDRISGLQVREAQDGDGLQPGTALLAPGDYHLRLRKAGARIQVQLDQGDKIHGLRPAGDALLPGLAPMFGDAIVVAVFTGMGHDGTMGIQALQNHRIACLTQTAESCVVYGMPAAVDQGGLSQAHFSPADFHQQICHFHWQG